MVTGLIVRKATVSDAQAIATVHVASWQVTYRGHMDDAFLDALTPESRAQMWIAALAGGIPRLGILVAEVENKIVGFCSTGQNRDTDARQQSGELFAIYVDPDHSREGIGTALLTNAEEAMRKGGFTSATLWVLRENSAARSFYERAGWTDDGREKKEDMAGRTIVEVRYSKTLTWNASPVG